MRQSCRIADTEVSVGAAPADWDDTIRQLGGSVFHSRAWAAYKHATRGVRPVFLRRCGEDGRPRGAALGFLRQSRLPFASRLSSVLQLPAHPVAAAGDAAGSRAVVADCEAAARRLGCRRIEIGSLSSGESAFLPHQHGYTEIERIEFTLDLTRHLDDLWRGIRKDQRERIRRLPREGVTVDVGTGREALDGLEAAREATQQKRSQRGQLYDLDADETFYTALYECLVKAGSGRLLLARHTDEVVAAIFFATFNERACSVFSGSTHVGYRLAAQSGLFWAAVQTFKNEGFTQLNRGGVPASAQSASDPLHGIYQFKRRLGTAPHLCRSGEKILSPVRDRLYRLGERARNFVRS